MFVVKVDLPQNTRAAGFNHAKPRSEKAFSSWFAEAATAAGIAEKSGHGLRKSRAMALAEAGATSHQIATWTGHESLSEVQGYSKAADRKRILSGTDQEQKLEPAKAQNENRCANYLL
ncbi:MAG: tyrosine-type recombinase/integrase [Paracoccus sp. (in: a-proteobacteria)]|uniref:tyrosine-type recombinase/integrase n=1 Tax=Paracoccus sp. TaxID=267 RepID=UPI0039E6A5C8